MPSKRDVLAHLTRDELLAAADEFELTVADRRVKDQLVNAVASSKKASLAEILDGLSRHRLKEVCRSLGLDDTGKEKAVVVERLTGAPAQSAPDVAPKTTPATPNPTGTSRSTPPPAKVGANCVESGVRLLDLTEVGQHPADLPVQELPGDIPCIRTIEPYSANLPPAWRG